MLIADWMSLGTRHRPTTSAVVVDVGRLCVADQNYRRGGHRPTGWLAGFVGWLVGSVLFRPGQHL